MTKREIDKIPDVTLEQWNSINPNNRRLADEFIEQNIQLSDFTLRQYTSAIRIYFWWVKSFAEDKNCWELKSKQFLMFQNYLIKRGLSSAAVKFKRSAVSSFNNYLETYYLDDYPNFRNYITRAIPSPKPVFVHDKEPLTLEEYSSLCKELEDKELYQQLAYLKFSFSTGARRNEVRQLLKEVVNYEPKISKVNIRNEDGVLVEKESRSYLTHSIRCKGAGKEGKIRKLQFDQVAMDAIKKWLDTRGDDECEYVFVTGKKEKKPVSESTFNIWCRNYFEPIVGRRIHPHIFRESRATSLVIEQGKDIKSVQKLLGHSSINVTQIYVIDKNEDNSDEIFV